MIRALFTVALSIVLASPAAAQALKLSFQNGLVSIDASAVPARTILTEWGKIGGTKIVGAERLAGAPVTLKLVNVPEAKALESVLRSAAGYMAAPRSASSTGPSIYDRILVMATSSAPTPSATAARPSVNPAFNGTQRFIPPRPQEADDQQDEPDDNPPNPPLFTFPPQPGQNGQPGNPPSFNGAPAPSTTNPSQPAPGAPAGSSAPGMIVAPPAQQQQQPATQPGSMIRPPGGRR